MINLSARTKAAILAFSIVASTNNTFCSEATSLSAFTDFLAANKTALSVIAGLLVAGEICLNTAPRVTYNYDNWTGDIKELLSAYNLFNAESRAVIKHFIKKYFIGAKIRLDPMTRRTKEEDGSVVTIERKKLTQKPSGLIGLFDAYILSQMKPISEMILPTVTLYLLIKNPSEAIQVNINKANKV